MSYKIAKDCGYMWKIIFPKTSRFMNQYYVSASKALKARRMFGGKIVKL